MRTFSIALAVVAGSTGLALAQPNPDEGAGSGAPVEPPPPPPPHATTPPPPPPPMQHETSDLRPSQLSIGIGVGYTFSTSLQTPNTVAVRVRLPAGLAFEPIVRIRNVSHTTTPVAGSSITDTATELGLGTNILIPVWHRGRADFDVLGQVTFDTEKDTPDSSAGDINKTTTTFGIGYGIEVGFWLSHHWLLTMTATNPVVTYSNTVNNMGGGNATKDSTTQIGLIFDPTVAFLVHLFI